MQTYYETVSQKTELLTSILNDLFSDYGFYVREEYSKVKAEYPIYNPILTVGMYSFRFDDSSMSKLLGIGSDTGYRAYGKMATVTYRITVHASADLANTVCRSAAANITQACNGAFDVRGVESGEARYDRSRRCVVMPIDVTVRYFV